MQPDGIAAHWQTPKKRTGSARKSARYEGIPSAHYSRFLDMMMVQTALKSRRQSNACITKIG
ncbi:hypothetical protein EKH55_4407 [Sinorhizobium alkalisoli]|nr:hypothetical protein EKH55_4407 [Sinorhizobium alkalisoli]